MSETRPVPAPVAGKRSRKAWIATIIVLVVLIVILGALTLVPLRQVNKTGADWLGFELGRENATGHVFDPGAFCPSQYPNGVGRVSLVWNTESGQPLQQIYLTVAVPTEAGNIVIYNATNSSSGGFAFNLTAPGGLTPCGTVYNLIMSSHQVNPTLISISTVYNYTTDVPIL